MSRLDLGGDYAEMATASNFSFLRGASHPKDLVLTAIQRGHAGLGLADRNTVAGVVRAWSALKELRAVGLAPPEEVRDGGSPGEIAFIEDPLNDPALSEEVKRRAANFRLVTGTRLVFNDGTPDVIAYPETRAGWGRLTRLLTLGNRRARKGECEIGLRDLLADPEDLLLILVPPDRLTGMEEVLTRMSAAAPGAVWLGAALHRRGDDRRRLARLKAMAERVEVPLLALNDVLYASPEDRDLQDVLTCIREGATIETAGRRLEANAERWLKPADEMARLFKDAPEAVAETTAFLSRATFDLSDLKYEYPEEPVPPEWEPQSWLEELVRRRTLVRYPDGAPAKVAALLKRELEFIAERSLAPYFLTIHDIVRTAEDKGILCQGRGSAANSAVCYVLGITSVDPACHNLLFERFLSSNRDEPPDIDVDFEHERREEIIQYIYDRYGRHRPGPIQGDMVHPYLRRRNGEEEVRYPPPGRLYGPPDELEQVLDRTLGVPLFQEQAMKVAMVAARFTDAEANGLRKAMGTFRGDGTLHTYEDRMVGRMIARGYDPAFAQRCFEQIKGFGSYGFPESHAASFARLVYVSSWIKHRHPAAFACALLNSQPMGFYAPAQIVREAQEVGGVEVRPIDVSHSDWDNSLEGPENAPVLRLGLRQIDGFREDWAKALSAARADRPFADIETLARRAELPAAAMRKLADADAFRSLGQDRREALWAVRRLPDDAPLPLFAAAEARERGARELGAEPDAHLPLMPLGEHVAADYQTARLSLKAHPMAILRPVFAADRVLTCAATEARRGGSVVRVAGVVLVRQRPGKGNAVFVTLEDETGITNIVLWARMLEQFRREVMSARLMQVEGVIEKSPEGVVHVVARRIIDRSNELARLSEDHDTEVQLARADIVAHPQPPRHPPHRHPRDVRILPGSRDFH